MATERNLTICKVCREIKPKVFDRKHNDKDKRFVDDEGNQWNGKTCPQCHKINVASRMRVKRAKPV